MCTSIINGPVVLFFNITQATFISMHKNAKLIQVANCQEAWCMIAPASQSHVLLPCPFSFIHAYSSQGETHPCIPQMTLLQHVYRKDTSLILAWASKRDHHRRSNSIPHWVYYTKPWSNNTTQENVHNQYQDNTAKDRNQKTPWAESAITSFCSHVIQQVRELCMPLRKRW